MVRKSLKFIFAGLILFLTACSSNTTTIKINGLTSDIKELNDKYNNKTEDEYFITLYVYSNDNGKVTYLYETGNYLMEVELRLNNNTVCSKVSKEYEIKTNDSIIRPETLEEKDILICYSKEILETHPSRIFVDDLYYLNTKTDKDLSTAKLAERV